MHDETVETYTNVYARWFAIISQFIVTASLCTLWRLQMTRYSQVLVHSTVVNSRLSHLSATFCRVFSRLLGWIWELFWGFLQFQLLFLGFSPALWLGLGSCFGVFCSFSYFFLAFLRLLSWVLGAVLVISAVSATFCETSGIMAEAQHHKLTTTY